VGYSDQTTETIQSALEDFMFKYIPGLKDVKITHRWSGVMGFSVDGQPMLGCLPQDNEIFFLGGFTAHGLGLAFHTAKTLVDCIYNRPIPNFISGKRFGC
jgi:glycine/D-amino acid oxidase-like deaminating enzyme